MTRNARSWRGALRYWLVLGALMAVFVSLTMRAVYLQVLSADYLQRQGDARYLRTVTDNAHRGMILDRNGEPLAVSTPVESVWAHPPTFGEARAAWRPLLTLLGLNATEVAQQLHKHAGREFMYLKRHVPPDIAERVTALNVPGVYLQREYRRYYPTGAVSGHVIGFTDVDDQGQEGLELAYDDRLRATPGTRRVLKDLYGNIVETVEIVSLPVPGRDLVVSIDKRIQYLTYRELKAAMQRYGARAATAIVLDAQSGEVLALVNQPAFNPNNRANLRSALFRNRAVTDVFEPGSTMKPFTIAVALESGVFDYNSKVDTTPGRFRVGSKIIHDERNYGLLSLGQVIEKSSNVGAARIALALDKERMWSMFRNVGFGETTGSQLPGESAGLLNLPSRWVPTDQAHLAFGYGISVTALQLARAYAALANDGVVMPVTLLRRDQPVHGLRVMSAVTARHIRDMLELAVSPAGTGTEAQVQHYRVAGKTGTVHKLVAGDYAEDRYIASFAGMAPASHPRLVMVVTMDEPSEGAYFGGQVAAPVFSSVMSDALRLLNVPPDTPTERFQWAAPADGQSPT
jgi:cell division protein FtsI (penicillin-binding protein 3)